jgi:hypothetical protein
MPFRRSELIAAASAAIDPAAVMAQNPVAPSARTTA